MQGLVDGGRMGCSSIAARSADISTNQKTLFATLNLSLLHFVHEIKVYINSFTSKYVNSLEYGG
jgi:hypothetical protein